MTTRLAMFPLGTVLVPYSLLPLHVFEPRYRVLMFDSLRADRRFGVVLIERGQEVGGGDQRFETGTLAHIEAAKEQPDGRWVLVAKGAERFRVERWLDDDPYPAAEVSELAELPFPTVATDGRQSLVMAARAVGRLLVEAAQAGWNVGPTSFPLDPDPIVASWQLLAAAPLGSLDRQRLLEVSDHRQRLWMLAEAADEQVAMLAERPPPG